jgi:hypothetical protein
MVRGFLTGYYDPEFRKNKTAFRKLVARHLNNKSFGVVRIVPDWLDDWQQ